MEEIREGAEGGAHEGEGHDVCSGGRGEAVPTDPGEGHRGGDEDGSSAQAGQGKDGSGQGRGSSGGVHGWVDNARREASRGVGMGTVQRGGELTGEPNRGGARQTRGGAEQL